MHRVTLGCFVAVAALLAPVPVAAIPGPQQKQEEKKEQKNQKSASLRGCVDQEDGRYVLVDEQGLKRIAGLEADGFPTEGFAKFLGHKVTVRGIGIVNGSQPLFRVRSIETISEICAPQN